MSAASRLKHNNLGVGGGFWDSRLLKTEADECFMASPQAHWHASDAATILFAASQLRRFRWKLIRSNVAGGGGLQVGGVWVLTRSSPTTTAEASV